MDTLLESIIYSHFSFLEHNPNIQHSSLFTNVKLRISGTRKEAGSDPPPSLHSLPTKAKFLHRQGHSANGTELGESVLAEHGQLLSITGIRDKGLHVVDASLQITLIILGVGDQSGAPGVSLEGLAGNQHRGGGDHRGQMLGHRVLLHAALSQVAGQLHHGSVGVRGLEVSAEEGVNGGHGETVAEHLQDVALHLHDLLLVVGAVGDVHQVLKLRWIDLLVLGSGKKSGHTDKLQAAAAHLLELQVTVNHVHSQVQGLGHHFELEMDVNLWTKERDIKECKIQIQGCCDNMMGAHHLPASRQGSLSCAR